jgi:quercetin dioxygenase-like cupin family protein
MGVIHRRVGDGPDWRWDGVDVTSYVTNNATKQVLIGAEDGAANFVLRFFTIPPRGFSSLDQHGHDHGVMIMNGRAKVMLGEEFQEVQAGDIVYIPGWERHQFENLTDEPFTFLCIIPPKKPQADMPTQPAELEQSTSR